jgi:hypothetical protein
VRQVAQIGGGSEPVGLIQGASAGDGGQHLGQIRLLLPGVMGLVGGHHPQSQAVGHLPHEVVAGVVVREAVVPQFEMEAGAEQLPKTHGGRHRPGQVTPGGGGRHRPGMAAGQRPHLTRGRHLDQIFPCVTGASFTPRIWPRVTNRPRAR